MHNELVEVRLDDESDRDPQLALSGRTLGGSQRHGGLPLPNRACIERVERLDEPLVGAL